MDFVLTLYDVYNYGPSKNTAGLLAAVAAPPLALLGFRKEIPKLLNGHRLKPDLSRAGEHGVESTLSGTAHGAAGADLADIDLKRALRFGKEEVYMT